jgi:hypothetical protein
MQPTWLLSEFDRFQLTITSIPFATFLTEAFIQALGNGDAWNGSWYNNAQASGNQLYPAQLSKYFDMYSLSGITNYTIYWTWYLVTATLTPLTLIPMNFWFSMLNDMNWDEIGKVIVPSPIAWFFHIRGEQGWVLS